ncbi:polyhydroxyalkanoate biosynthesis repressor PhaR [Alkalihalobacterium alkalinitrilicum]|uniref:polyhydroxyalkanoate biosynthesis repressor PhaR n=1 Tax=Alkalihalobacterium alkalinitrilicum TaxID=427920 RepID=UPI000995365A|nr:polyhydroxyalkanoate biosynthesis repressor PhaR [Alkalihalobacterium alkalinitrilicum]
MSDYKTHDPYETFKKYSVQWEKQLNEMFYLWTNNPEFVRYTKMNSDANANFLEFFRKNQEFLANQLNIPTKTDLANVSKIAIQTEEKLDLLEEQIWNLSDSFTETNKEIESIVEVSREVIKVTKQLKSELTKTKRELLNTKNLNEELQEVKEELASLNGLKEELASVKSLMETTKSPNEEIKEAVLVGENDK